MTHLISRYGRKKIIYCLLFFMAVVVPDVLIDLTLSLLHLLFEILHLTFEFIESALDQMVEHLFHTDTHETQLIVFYILCSVAIYFLYRLVRAVTRYYQHLKIYFHTTTAGYKIRLVQYKSTFSPTQKV